MLSMNVRHKHTVGSEPLECRHKGFCKICKFLGTVGVFLKDNNSHPYGSLHHTRKVKISSLHSFLGELDPELWAKGVFINLFLACGSGYFTASFF